MIAAGAPPVAVASVDERVVLEQLPLPPTAPSTDPGACTSEINPRGTGCLDPGPDAISSPGQYSDANHVVVGVHFAGAAHPDAYSGPQVIVVKTDGTTFANGDPWKCVTCGADRQGVNPDLISYPQAFRDGRRVLAGTNVLDCGSVTVVDEACTPARLKIYPVRWNVTADGSGPGGSMRELRLHPDNEHLGWSHMIAEPGRFDQFAFAGRLRFNPSMARYDVTDAQIMSNADPRFQQFRIDPQDPGRLMRNPAHGLIGEFRGWSSDGGSALGIGTAESNNVDAFATRNDTGESRPLTRHVHYTDPIRVAPDDQTSLGMLVLGSGRMDFISALPGVPPLTDQYSTTGHISSIRNNGVRRFFSPYLINRDGTHQQRLNPGADPNWNSRADPAWSVDGTSVVYWESLVTTPACGGQNPLPCPASTEPGGRHVRLTIARFPDRTPQTAPEISPSAAQIGWGTPYHPGDPMPVRPHLPGGTYTLQGSDRGEATVTIEENADRTAVTSIAVRYHEFSDDGLHILNGTESVEGDGSVLSAITFHSDLRLTGRQSGTRVTSPDGFWLESSVMENNLQATGTMTTTIDGRTFLRPANGT